MIDRIKHIASEFSNHHADPLEKGLIDSFSNVCIFLSDNPNSLSWRGNNKPDVVALDDDSVRKLANKYFNGFRRSDFPANPSTVPDPMVSAVMHLAYDFPTEFLERIKTEHQLSMCAENCVGSLLERYLDSVLRPYGWHWCCGEFVKSIDFINYDEQNENWLALQIKNRDNSENSSSSSVRQGTIIKKWFRTFSRREETNWNALPELMMGYNLSEEGFHEFVAQYLTTKKI